MNTPDAEIPPVQILVLSRLLPAGDKGATTSQIRKDLEPLVGHRLSGGELTGLLDRTLDELAGAGLLSRIRKGKADRCVPSDAGRARALEALGLDGLPPKTTWSGLVSKYLAARALGLPAPNGPAAKAFGNDGGFKAAVLHARHGLPVGPFPTAAQAADALLWKLLGCETGRKFDLKSVREFLLARALGEAEEPAPEKASIQKLIARDLMPRNSKPAELRAAAIRKWAGASLAPAAPSEATAPIQLELVPEPAPAPLLEDFARRVAAAARSCPSGRFGEGKVFIAHVWGALRDDPDFAGLDLEGFKRRLAEANRERLLDLSRADLVEAMDPDDVRDSEMAHFGARFHFIKL